ncbi:mercaptopyruvate sulfurtransferase [Reticulomyxa filosa]|uniref:Mercaptopyruvate sulfurtransferase n=1 Tax=Reticulomyxa filosa TaxID=46433 RepID=X6NLJ9_RETFI|nr:mercaptopyruvate sulfurtransferase [Reticulomyxa filosa]|eukprot:ETO26257.1 mercaptopyruvate sulfurtransferase [Reticulomyxa filosa]
MFKAMGVKNVSVLNGGFPLWRKEKRPVEEGPVKVPQTNQPSFAARFNAASIALSYALYYRILYYTYVYVCTLNIKSDIARIKKIVAGTDDALIVDARSPDRFSGKIKETNPALRSGHIPGSVSLFYELLLDDSKLCYHHVNELRSIFENLGIDVKKRPIVTTCGSGVTAAIVSCLSCIFMVGIHLVQWTDKTPEQFPPLSLYNGSWNEWGSRKDCPVECD